MWYQVHGEQAYENGAAAGSRAVLLLAVFFFVGCVAHGVMTIVSDIDGIGPLSAEIAAPMPAIQP